MSRRETGVSVADAISRIPDPELPLVTIADLGILRDVEVDEQGRSVTVTITPTYSGCPAIEAIADRVAFEAGTLGYAATVRTSLTPAWTSDWLSAAGRDALRRFGIAPPGPAGPERSPWPTGPVPVELGRHVVACPRCGSTDTTELAHFGSTACKALRRCEACREPFEQFKAL